MQEAELYQAWQSRARNSRPFFSEGHRIKVLYAGQLNKRCGPDFVGARFELDGTVYQGDVECHLQPDDWYTHRHQMNRDFASVVLHLVARKPQTGLFKVDHYLNPFPIPTLILPMDEQSDSSKQANVNCLQPKKILAHIGENLSRLALYRFDQKTHQYQKETAQKSFEQVFYEYSFRLLGYPHNGAVFQNLARRLDLPWLKSWRARIWSESGALFALYAGQAGFLSEAAADDYCVNLQLYCQRFKAYLPGPTGEHYHWEFSGLRDNNHPHFRLAGWCDLLYKRPQPTFEFLEQQLANRYPFEVLYKNIQDYFMLECPEYWRTHFALGRRRKSRKARYYFGPARISEWLINVILPLFAAGSRSRHSSGFEIYLRQFYLWLPAVCGYAGIQKKFPWLKAIPKCSLKQVYYQGLIQLDKEYCASALCRQCPLL